MTSESLRISLPLSIEQHPHGWELLYVKALGFEVYLWLRCNMGSALQPEQDMSYPHNIPKFLDT